MKRRWEIDISGGGSALVWAALVVIGLALLLCGCCGGDIIRAMMPGPSLGEF